MVIITEGRAAIAATPAQAWAFLADYANDPRWRTGVERMQQTPPGMVFDGAPVVEDLRLLGRLTTTHIEVFDVRPEVSFSWRAVDGSHARGTRTLAPRDGGCELVTWREIALTGADRLLQPLVSAVMSRQERANVLRAARLIELSSSAGG